MKFEIRKRRSATQQHWKLRAYYNMHTKQILPLVLNKNSHINWKSNYCFHFLMFFFFFLLCYQLWWIEMNIYVRARYSDRLAGCDSSALINDVEGRSIRCAREPSVSSRAERLCPRHRWVQTDGRTLQRQKANCNRSVSCVRARLTRGWANTETCTSSCRCGRADRAGDRRRAVLRDWRTGWKAGRPQSTWRCTASHRAARGPRTLLFDACCCCCCCWGWRWWSANVRWFTHSRCVY